MSHIMDCINAQMSYDCVPEASECWCRGSGWILSDWDSFHKCRYHYKGQPNNESEPEEWDIWLDNVNGDGQFMVIPFEEKTLSWTDKTYPKTTEEEWIAHKWVNYLKYSSTNSFEEFPF